jgi:glycosyltransferase involved in cell wall biosynthesis
MSSGNAALYYLPDGFDTTREKLMGRHAAGEGMLRGMARYFNEEEIFCFAPNVDCFNDFKQRFSNLGGDVNKAKFIHFANLAGLATSAESGGSGGPGGLFMSQPGIGQAAWLRRGINHPQQQRAYSLSGLTHTTASGSVMSAIADLIMAPVQPWDAVICTSTSVKKTFHRIFEQYGEYLKSRFGAKVDVSPKLQLPVIPLGVDMEHFAPKNKPQLRKNWRDKLNIQDTDIAVLFVGRLSFHAKAHPWAMYAALEKAAQETGRKIHLIQAGWFANQPIEDAFRNGAKAACPSVICHFLDGRPRDVRDQIWHAADLFCSLSDNIQETFGITPIEAMAAGLPCVVSDWDGYKDTIPNGEVGFRIPTLAPAPGMGYDLAFRHEMELDNYDMYIGNAALSVVVDIQEATKAFVKLIVDENLRAKMSAAAIKRVQQLYDWRVVVKSYQDLWVNLAEIRSQAEEICPLQPGFAPNPLRDDPFHLFADYPTRSIHDSEINNARLELAADLGSIERSLRMPLNNFGLIGRTETALEICRMIESGQALPENPMALKTLLYLLKLGLVRFAER